MRTSGAGPSVFGSATFASIGCPSKDGTRVETEPWQKRVPSDWATHGIFPKAVGWSAWAAAGTASKAAASRGRSDLIRRLYRR
jgi:hypothetical protein